MIRYENVMVEGFVKQFPENVAPAALAQWFRAQRRARGRRVWTLRRSEGDLHTFVVSDSVRGATAALTWYHDRVAPLFDVGWEPAAGDLVELKTAADLWAPAGAPTGGKARRGQVMRIPAELTRATLPRRVRGGSATFRRYLKLGRQHARGEISTEELTQRMTGADLADEIRKLTK